MSTAQAQDGIGKYLVVYICMLVLSAIELMIAYGHASGGHLLVSMLLPAFIGAVLGVVYFMGLGSENQKAILAFCVFTLFVLATINYGWTDSFRLLLGAPFSKYH
jgi:heme/copper-type cytochrome/quinol oxidase subunit 4